MHRSDHRLRSAADDTAVGFAKGPDLIAALVACESQSSSLCPYGMAEVAARTAPANSNDGASLAEDEATTVGSEVAVEMAVGVLG